MKEIKCYGIKGGYWITRGGRVYSTVRHCWMTPIRSIGGRYSYDLFYTNWEYEGGKSSHKRFRVEELIRGVFGDIDVGVRYAGKGSMAKRKNKGVRVYQRGFEPREYESVGLACIGIGISRKTFNRWMVGGGRGFYLEWV